MDVVKETTRLSLKQEIKCRMVAMRKKQKNLAEDCGWSKSTLSYKMNESNFCISDLEKMANSLNCDLEIRLVPREDIGRQNLVPRGQTFA